jgi:hypothetical protein
MVRVTGLTADNLNILVNGKTYVLPFDRFKWFRFCTIEELLNVERQGAAVVWPAVDIGMELEAIEHPEKYTSYVSVKKWQAMRRKRLLAEIGKKGGAARSASKAAASRANGKKGGRPRREHAPA